MTTLVIQIPAFNEAPTLPAVLAELPRELPGVDKIFVLVIDDGSSDDTGRVALRNGADFVLRHRQNRGLSRAFISGIQFGLALGADLIVNTDADGQYPGAAIAELIAPILSGEADLAIGDRQLKQNQHFSPMKRLLEELGSAFVRRVSFTKVPDAASGFRAFSRFAALQLQVYNPYSYTLETLIQAGKGGFRISNVAITTNPAVRQSRLHKSIGHFIWRQSGAIIRSYVLYQPLRTFLTLGAVSFGAGAILILRFLITYFFLDPGSSRHVQSVSLGGALLVAGIILTIFGFLGDALRASRKLTEESLIHLRDVHQIGELSQLREFCGQPIYSKFHPFPGD